MARLITPVCIGVYLLRPPHPQDWGFTTPTPKPKAPIAIVSERVKLYGLKIWPEHSQGPSEQKPIKNFGEKGAWAYPGSAQIVLSEIG